MPWKIQGCACPDCSEAQRRIADNQWARLTIIGLALGAGLILAADFILDGPGLFSIFIGA